MKKILILLVFLLPLFSCVEDDDGYTNQIRLGNITVTPTKAEYKIGELVYLKAPYTNSNNQYSNANWSWQVTHQYIGAIPLIPSDFTQYPSLQLDHEGTCTLRSTLILDEMQYEYEPKMIRVVEHTDDPVYGEPSGSVIFWAKGNQITPPVWVYTLGLDKEIERTFIQTPHCGNNDVAQWDNIPYGTYYFTAQDTAGVTWNGHYTVDQDCNGVKLLYSGNGNRSTAQLTGTYEEVDLSLQ